MPRQLADRPQAPPCPRRRFPQREMPPSRTTGYQPSFQRVVSLTGAGCLRVTHPSAARGAILCHPPPDLHVLGTPPALTLSQDQTLHKNLSPAKCHSHGTTPHQTPIDKFLKLLITLSSQPSATTAATPRIVSFLLSCVFVCFCAVRARRHEPQTLRLRSRTGRPFMHRLLKNFSYAFFKAPLYSSRLLRALSSLPACGSAKNYLLPCPRLSADKGVSVSVFALIA